VTKLLITLDDAETRAVWETALRAHYEVAAWPAWKHNEQPKDPVTANYDIALHDLAIHSAVTVDMRPDWHETTTVGPPAPERLPYRRPIVVLPDLDTATDDDISDLAANCASDTQAGADDLWLLSGSQGHIRRICEQLGSREMELDNLRERVDNLSASVATLTKQLEVAHSIGHEYRGKAQRYEQALVMTTNDLYREKNEVVRLKALLATEQARSSREASNHTQTIERLTAMTIENFGLTRKLAEMEKK
jgi:hypothetical protein